MNGRQFLQYNLELLYYQIRIIGEVTKPGEIVYPRGKTMDLGSAIGLVGNMTIDADERDITLKRNEVVTNVSVSELSATILQDGDIISIGKLAELGTFSISGEVVKAGTYVIPREKEGKLSIFAAISIAGGPSKVAKLSKTIVTRNSANGKTSSITVDATDRSKVFFVRPGDEILVSDNVYGPTKEISEELVKEFNINAKFYDPDLSLIHI